MIAGDERIPLHDPWFLVVPCTTVQFDSGSPSRLLVQSCHMSGNLTFEAEIPLPVGLASYLLPVVADSR